MKEKVKAAGLLAAALALLFLYLASSVLAEETRLGSVTIHYADGTDGTQPLPGASFSLTLTEAIDNVLTGTTDARGELCFEGLVPGIYEGRQLEAPEGYRLSEPFTLTIPQQLTEAQRPAVNGRRAKEEVLWAVHVYPKPVPKKGIGGDNQTPGGGASGTGSAIGPVKTGDTAGLWLWFSLMAAAGILVLVVLFFRRDG
ncbi:MAG: prealbumin-like fold domain-containing protein [Lachnospiraceae bacterium]|nr:prealbumin-like fold domain-containing protein [Lachnospiraceae bacterium]